jgi:hypothetical protein
MYLIFEATVKGFFFFMISFSACSLMGYRKTIDFCMLIFYPATLPKVFINYKSSLLKSLGILSIGSYHLQTEIM